MMQFILRLIPAVLLTCLCTQSHSATIQTGDLLISEVMANPQQVSDSNGEWFEIFNASANSIDINDFTISDAGSNSHLINNNDSLLIDSGAYLVLGRNGDNSSNGGYTADYVYTDFTLGNSSDQIILSHNNIEIARLDYSASHFGVAGTSAELITQLASPTNEDYQLTQHASYGLGDSGTPGAAGSFSLSAQANPVPVPAAVWLFLSGLMLLLKQPVKQVFQQIIKWSTPALLRVT